MDSVLKEVTALWRFEHISSSPLYAPSNGEVERAVQTLTLVSSRRIVVIGLCATRIL